MHTKVQIVFLALIALVFNTIHAYAHETGFVNIHELRRYGRYLCTVSHEHAGVGNTKKTKKLAIRSAVRKWSNFTAWEYGPTWGKWRYARGKSVSCKGAKGAVSCTVTARPCKRLRKIQRRN